MNAVSTFIAGWMILSCVGSAFAQPADAVSGPAVDAVKAEIKQRSKTSGTLDVYDNATQKVRTLHLMAITAAENDTVTGEFRDTKTGDVVMVESKLGSNNTVGDFTITSAKALQPVKEAKKDYTDQDIQDFMKEYIATQSEGTGTFLLFDEKTQTMRKLELIKLQEKVRRFGIIAISTVEFKEKDTGDTILADVNVENKDGLNVSAIRIKNVVKSSGSAASTK